MVTTETPEQKVRRLTSERIAIAAYDPAWPMLFAAEEKALRARFRPDLIMRIEHFGSTAVPGLAAKPVIDMLIEVATLDRARFEIAPLLEAQGYDYLWRPTLGDGGEPFYAWFIKRDAEGRRTHHLHMVEASFEEHWRRLLFRDYLIAHPEQAWEYEQLKRNLAAAHPNDRAAYTNAKSAFIQELTAAAERDVARLPAALPETLP